MTECYIQRLKIGDILNCNMQFIVEIRLMSQPVTSPFSTITFLYSCDHLSNEVEGCVPFSIELLDSAWHDPEYPKKVCSVGFWVMWVGRRGPHSDLVSDMYILPSVNTNQFYICCSFAYVVYIRSIPLQNKENYEMIESVYSILWLKKTIIILHHN